MTKNKFSEVNEKAWQLDYLKINPYKQDVFSFLEKVKTAFYNGITQPIKEYDFCGGRKGRKTHEIIWLCIQLIMIAMATKKKVAIYGFRELGSDIQELRQEFDTQIEAQGITPSEVKQIIRGGYFTYKNAQNMPFYMFIGGSFIQLKGLHKATSNKISLKGLASANDYDLAISFCEEANEMSNDEFHAVDFAVRGANEYVKFKASNPDNIFEDYIAYFEARCPSERKTLETKGYQMKKVEEAGISKLFLHTNYTINPYLSTDDVKEFEQLKLLDYQKWLVWGLGMPGSMEDSIFARYIANARPGNNFIAREYWAGLDLGQSDGPEGHPTAAELVGVNENHQIKCLGEWFHSNATQEHLDPMEIADRIIDFYLSPYFEYQQLEEQEENHELLDHELLDDAEALYYQFRNQGLTVWTDYGSGGRYMIAILNERLAKRFPSETWLRFLPVDKDVWFVKERIDATITLFNANKLFIDISNDSPTPMLVQQMNIMKYKLPKSKDSEHKIEVVDLNDDCWDALCYALMPQLASLVREVAAANTLLVGKRKLWKN